MSLLPDVVLRGHAPFRKRGGRGLVTFAAATFCKGISFTHIALALRPNNYLEKIDGCLWSHS